MLKLVFNCSEVSGGAAGSGAGTDAEDFFLEAIIKENEKWRALQDLGTRSAGSRGARRIQGGVKSRQFFFIFF